jgi:hypothetical protein
MFILFLNVCQATDLTLKESLLSEEANLKDLKIRLKNESSLRIINAYLEDYPIAFLFIMILIYALWHDFTEPFIWYFLGYVTLNLTVFISTLSSADDIDSNNIAQIGDNVVKVWNTISGKRMKSSIFSTISEASENALSLYLALRVRTVVRGFIVGIIFLSIASIFQYQNPHSIYPWENLKLNSIGILGLFLTSFFTVGFPIEQSLEKPWPCQSRLLHSLGFILSIAGPLALMNSLPNPFNYFLFFFFCSFSVGIRAFRMLLAGWSEMNAYEIAVKQNRLKWLQIASFFDINLLLYAIMRVIIWLNLNYGEGD